MFDKPYDPQKTEEKIYKLWEKSGFFNPDKLPQRHKKPFSMSMAPPNITGSLHMGHALEYTMSDILIRYKRMKGYKTLWLPGTDHAGIATQNVVEKELKKEGLTRHQLGREKFLKRVWEWKEKYGHIIIDQLKKLGVSADWSRTKFTMDKDYQTAVKKAFLHYYKKGWIYQGLQTVNWCPRCSTSLSDLELEYQEEKAKLYYIKYGPFTLATVRPETKFGDTALAVNPHDKRYKKYIGKTLEVESLDVKGDWDKPGKTKIKLYVVADEAVDPKFGTGVIKVTPAHDITDFEISKRHKLPMIQVIDPDGRMNKRAGKYGGMKVKEARAKIAADLKAVGLLVKEEEYEHRVATCYRCATTIEPLPSKQWFLKMDKLAKMAERAVRTGKVKIIPKNFEKPYFDWLKNIRDWTISRQIWWGHKIPLPGVEDVLDTWFSSALWPFAAFGWPKKNKDLRTFYPTNVITNDRGILNLWDARMIFSGLELTKQVPFRELVIHATILTRQGKRMSKSLGTGVDPADLILRYGADATRFGLIWQAMGGQDIRWAEEHVLAGKKFANKLWNIARYITIKAGGDWDKYIVNKKKPFHIDETIIWKGFGGPLRTFSKDLEKLIENYAFGEALHIIYDDVWHKLADKYIEEYLSKDDYETKSNLVHFLINVLKRLHPFMPFVTEEIYQQLPFKNKKLLMIEQW